MDGLWALASIAGILGVVLIGGYMMAALVNMISNAFSGTTTSTGKSKTEILDYTEFKSYEDSKALTDTREQALEFDENKAAVEERALNSVASKTDDYKFEDVADDGDLDKIETRLQENESEKASTEAPIAAPAVESAEEDDDDLDSLLDDISNDVIENTKEQINTEDEEAAKPSSLLDNYNLDEILDNLNKEDEAEEQEELVAVEPAAQETTNEAVEDTTEEVVETTETKEEVIAPQEEQPQEEEPIVEEAIEEEEVPAQVVAEPTAEEIAAEEARKRELEELKRQVAELNKQLEEARSSTPTAGVVEVVIDMTEEECVNKIAVLEERLKNLRKDYKTNLKEYKPLRRVRDNLEKYQTKLRRREAVAAKKKVALYGVNNYVDIDKDKAEKLANELELLDGLRLSVQHCEEVIESSKDRYPILENTNNILEEQIANTEADLNELQVKLAKIRENKGGNGEGNNEQ